MLIRSKNDMRRRPLTKKPYYLLLIPIFLIVIGQMSTKYGATLLNESSAESSYLGLNLFILAGYFCLVVRGGAWVFILKKIELSVAYPTLSISFVFILILSNFFFGEQTSLQKVIGTIFIVFGVIVIGLSSINDK